MFFLSSERRRINRDYDRFIQDGNETLALPEVTKRLGSLASEILVTLNSSFVPNFRFGQFKVPRSQLSTDNVALIPLSPEHANRAYEITRDFEDDIDVRERSFDESLYSQRYNISLSPKELIALTEPNSEVTDSEKQKRLTEKGLPDSVIGRTQAGLSYALTLDSFYMQRPRIMVRTSALEYGRYEAGAVLAHEIIHAHDMLENAWVHATPRATGASELRAYHVGAEIYQAIDSNSQAAQYTLDIEEARKREVGGSEHPFLPNDVMMDELYGSATLSR